MTKQKPTPQDPNETVRQVTEHHGTSLNNAIQITAVDTHHSAATLYAVKGIDFSANPVLQRPASPPETQHATPNGADAPAGVTSEAQPAKTSLSPPSSIPFPLAFHSDTRLPTPNGLTNEVLLAIVADRLAGRATKEMDVAHTFVTLALDWLSGRYARNADHAETPNE